MEKKYWLHNNLKSKNKIEDIKKRKKLSTYPHKSTNENCTIPKFSPKLNFYSLSFQMYYSANVLFTYIRSHNEKDLV